MGRVYVSSTRHDLIEERLAARAAILRLDHHPVGMEDYGSGESAPVEKCLEDVRSCHAYVGLLAWRYGFSPPGSAKSITELEYEEAGKSDIPRLIYLSPERDQWTGRVADGDPARIRAFRDRVRAAHVLSSFASGAELQFKLGTDLNRGLGRGVPVPALLPYLCDRDAQIRSLRALLAAREDGAFHAPMLCVLHGPETQALGKFLDCLKSHYLPEALGTRGEGLPVVEYRVRWPKSKVPAAFTGELSAWLGQEVCHAHRAEREAIAAVLAQHPSTVLITANLPTETWTSADRALLEAFAKYWLEWPPAPRPSPRLVVLFVPYRIELGGLWKNILRGRSIRRRNEEIHSAIEALSVLAGASERLLIFPRLEDVARADVEFWAGRPEVKQLAGRRDLERDIRQLFAQRASLPMEELAPQLEALLQQETTRRSA